MIASERSLASAHQTQAQQRRQTSVAGIGKSKNGSSKPPVRPVKVYVLDPKTLQQRLEAYVGQKNKKDNGDEKMAESKSKDETQCPQPCTTAVKVTTPSIKSTTTVAPTKLLSPLKYLPPIAPRVSSVTTADNQIPVSTQEGTVLSNGVTLQCIGTNGFGLPAVPLMVTNGVALLQTPISQASIQASGLFLPGITAIPSVINGGTNGTIIGSAVAQVSIKPKTSAPPKRKSKKKKGGKKRKLSSLDKDKEDDDDSELAYLRKETTTRLGRVSRPVSQPHSPAFSAASSRVPSPSSKKKLKKTQAEGQKFRCQACFFVCDSKEKLTVHFNECQQEKATIIREQNALQSHTKPTTSTNSLQGTTPPSTLVPVPHPLAAKDEGVVPLVVTPGENLTLSSVNSVCKSTPVPGEPILKSYDLPISNTGRNECITIQLTKPIEFPPTTAQSSISSLGLMSGVTQGNEYFPASYSYSKCTMNYSISDIEDNDSIGNNQRFKVSIPSETALNVSLVPTSEEPKELLPASSNVDLVPSSYSIPSSPPSQCHSPGLPYSDNNLNPNIMTKEGTSSPERVCNSPVDPMLLRSRSPFPPPMHEISLHSVSASNLSIPEESLCRGELFMDLGGSILETSGLSRISPFCNESVHEPLFENSPAKPIIELVEVVPSVDVDADIEPEMENTSAPTPPQVVGPILNTEDANDGEIFQSANFSRSFVHPSTIMSVSVSHDSIGHKTGTSASGFTDLPKTPLSTVVESDLSMDSSEVVDNSASHKRGSVWQFVKQQIQFCGISQACGEISEMADKLSRIARDQFIPIREEEIERMGNSAPIIHVDTPFFSHLLDLPFGTYIFKEDAGKKKKVPPPPPPLTSSELSFTGGVEDVEKFLPPNIDLITLPHLTNLDLI